MVAFIEALASATAFLSASDIPDEDLSVTV
jgi:hypothetical protein